MGVGSSISLHKARSCEVTAGKLFDDMDTSGDGQLTVVELYDATMRYGWRGDLRSLDAGAHQNDD
jgi:hypothetical protein